MATPAAAVGHTNRWVDDDVVAGDGPSNCDSAAYSSIQDAIDDSSAGDWVYVCPGAYSEELSIPAGVKVRARPNFHAKLVAPLVGTATLVTMPGDGARLRGFVIQIPAGEATLSISPTVAVCHHYDAAIIVTGNNAVVRDNRISAVDGQTLGGSCGYDYGIVIGEHGDSATARVTFNWVTDFKAGGILVEDDDSYAWIRRNTVRYLHENECNIIAITGCTISLRPSVNSSVNDAFSLAFGIGVESNARADIIKNWIGSGPNACSTGPSYACSPGFTPTLNDGISLTGLDGSETTTVSDNKVVRTTGGIVTRTAADGALIHGNWVYSAHYGYQVGGDNDEWYGNHTSGNDIGISVGGSGNYFHDNDFRGNLGVDCSDNTSGSGTASTANTWTNDLGNVQSPEGICVHDGT
jgi:hypothetical protein